MAETARQCPQRRTRRSRRKWAHRERDKAPREDRPCTDGAARDPSRQPTSSRPHAGETAALEIDAERHHHDDDERENEEDDAHGRAQCPSAGLTELLAETHAERSGTRPAEKARRDRRSK